MQAAQVASRHSCNSCMLRISALQEKRNIAQCQQCACAMPGTLLKSLICIVLDPVPTWRTHLYMPFLFAFSHSRHADQSFVFFLEGWSPRCHACSVVPRQAASANDVQQDQDTPPPLMQMMLQSCSTQPLLTPAAILQPLQAAKQHIHSRLSALQNVKSG